MKEKIQGWIDTAKTAMEGWDINAPAGIAADLASFANWVANKFGQLMDIINEIANNFAY